jgi:hypothetical protein
MVVEMSQKRDVPFDPAQPELGTFPLRTAATVLISKPVLSDGKEQSGEICYIIGKGLDPGSDAHRTEQQRRFHERSGLVEGSDPSRFQLDFNLLHGGI